MRRSVLCLLICLVSAPAAGAAVGHRVRSGPLHGPQGPLTPGQVQALRRSDHTLIELDRERGHLAVPLLRRYGAKLVSKRLQLWRVPSGAAPRLVGELQVAGTLRAVQPDRPLRTPAYARRRGIGDPLVAKEYWRKAIAADRAPPPPAGIAVTVIDTGVDFTHPEFAGRPDTVALNRQFLVGADDEHGTAVSSVVGAPENGIGLVGVYPQATLWAWDASPRGRGTLSNEIRGIDVASSRSVGVINLSLGSDDYDPIEDDAIQSAFGAGTLIVASAGNGFEEGNPVEYPASLSHVLTVGATNERNETASFSSASAFVDLAAPGVAIPVAVPRRYRRSGYDLYDGTSFSAPLVSGAAGWVWTVRPELDNTQIFELMRRSARDIEGPGVDRDTGYGLLNIARALAFTAPARDPQEPNDDIDHVKPYGLFVDGSPLLTTKRQPSATISGRVDASEDPDDLYRIVVPPGRTVVVTATGSYDVDLDLWGPQTRSVFEDDDAALERDLFAESERPSARAERVRYRNRSSRAVVLYPDVFPGRRVDHAAYRLSITTVG